MRINKITSSADMPEKIPLKLCALSYGETEFTSFIQFTFNR